MPLLSKTEINQLVKIIQDAESCSTGEIRIYIDKHPSVQCYQTALEKFKELNMTQTKAQNGVLFYINTFNQHLSILGDKNIHHFVKQAFWDNLHQKTIQFFKENKIFEGLKYAILTTGLELKKYFPVSEKNNPNELPDEIIIS